jgi:hypothetical protein
MSRSTFDYYVYLPLPDGPISPDWLGPKFLATLDTLTRIDPILSLVGKSAIYTK